MVTLIVALRKESVDRNCLWAPDHSQDYSSLSARRAWIEILLFTAVFLFAGGSLSARRAWIEILCLMLRGLGPRPSLSARRAWIEMLKDFCANVHLTVSLSARRAWIEISYGALEGASEISRSPQGERG